MKQLGNLAIVCAQRQDVVLLLQRGKVSVFRETTDENDKLSAAWDDDAAIEKIVHELNFGAFAHSIMIISFICI